MKKDRTYNKLVRDHVPEILERQGMKPLIRHLEDQEYVYALHEKLKEEMREYMAGRNIDELADIVEVINAILSARHHDGGAGSSAEDEGADQWNLQRQSISGESPDAGRGRDAEKGGGRSGISCSAIKISKILAYSRNIKYNKHCIVFRLQRPFSALT